MEHSTAGRGCDRPRLRRRGTDVQGTRCREGDTGRNVLLNGTTGVTLSTPTVSSKLQEIAKQAVEHPERVFTTLAHHINVELLYMAFMRTSQSSGSGVDGVTAKEYEANLSENLEELHERLKSGSYRAMPVERVWLEKPDGGQRPIGKPVLEDKIVQRAVVMLLEQIYEQDFYDFSYGFRRGRNPHQALKSLRQNCMMANVQWIIGADISGFFDAIDHKHLRDLIRRRMNDGSVIRLIGRWLHAGVLEEGKLSHPEAGTPQGGVISPLLANIYLHYVLDDWFVKDVQPLMKGRTFLIRFADDFIIGCEREDDAKRLMEVLSKRFARFALTIHSEKSKLVEFGEPAGPRYRSREGASKNGQSPESEKGTFDFLGFTHYWARTRTGQWVIKRRTARKRLRRTVKAIWAWCKAHRHDSMTSQYRTLVQKLRGHFQYYGVRCNYDALMKVFKRARRAWFYWINKRRRHRDYNWEEFDQLLETVFKFPKPRIIHQDI